jgi:hypothetical protein
MNFKATISLGIFAWKMHGEPAIPIGNKVRIRPPWKKW